jgi:hypothetical protein
MHFCTEKFWEQLDQIVHEETKFIFNLVNPSDNKTEWKESKSFLKIEDNIVQYQFEWTHQDVKTEPLISEKIINDLLAKYNWKILSKHNIDSQYSLLNFYGWWIVQKC